MVDVVAQFKRLVDLHVFAGPARLRAANRARSFTEVLPAQRGEITDALGLKLIEHIGVDKVMWAVDYPHAEGSWGVSEESIRQVLDAVSPEDAKKILGGNATSPFRTLADFVAAAKAKPGELNYATVGPATTQHIGMESFLRTAGIKLTYVPFGGGAPATNALLGGHVMAVLANPSEVMEQVNAGKLRALAVASRERFSQLPNTPTIAESGYKDFEAVAWFGLTVPAKTPKDVVASHISMFKAALANADVQAKLTAQGYNTIGVCGADFAAHIKRQHDDYARVTKDANIKVD